MSTPQISKQLQKHLVEEYGKDRSRWPEELRDVVDPSITARAVSPPISGKVEKFLNTDYHYHWAFDKCGQEPNHDRVESMRWAGWDYATTKDVKMCSEDAVKGRNKDGFSDEIRSGDRRLMKLPMRLWRETRKAQNLAAYQMAYPQPFDQKGQPMSAENLIPGLRTEQMDEAEINEAQSRFTPANSVKQKTHAQIEQMKKDS